MARVPEMDADRLRTQAQSRAKCRSLKRAATGVELQNLQFPIAEIAWPYPAAFHSARLIICGRHCLADSICQLRHSQVFYENCGSAFSLQ